MTVRAESVPEKIDYARETLKALGETGGFGQIGKLLGVSGSTVWRWKEDEVTPRARQATGLDMLCRTLHKAGRGDKDALRIRAALLSAGGEGLLAMGARGMLIAAGYSWLLGPGPGKREDLL